MDPRYEAILDSVPRQARASEPQGDGCVAILVPKFGGRILAKWLMPRLRRPDFRVRLDALGSFVWERSDGTRTAREILAEVAARFPDLADPAARLALFLGQLAIQRHVTLTRVP
jgi:hypothetical protein